jgi:DNA-binding winged helix-turn-helix (wHTH) protein/tetratricopeptide (TPR) repeat protein
VQAGPRPESYRFATFLLDAEKRVLYRGDAPVPLTPKAFDTLMVLVRAEGRVVSKEELLRQVWPDTFIEENSLTQVIFLLRRALGPGPEGQSYIETVPKRGYRLAAGLELAGDAPTPAVEPPPAPPARRRLKPVYLAIALAAVLAAGAVYVLRRPAPPNVRRSVAVIQFRNLSARSDAAWMATALSEMFRVELGAGGALRTVPGESVARARTDLGLSEADSFTRETLARIRDRMGCDLVVAGSYLPLGGKVRVDVQLQDATSGEVLSTVTQTDAETNLLDLVASVGTRLRETLNVGSPSNADQQAIRAAMPANAEAARLYSEGLARLRLFDAPGAQELLARSVNADTKFPLSHSALSRAWSLLGYDPKAAAEAKIAFDLSGGLSREERLLVEGRYREALSDWRAAIDVYRALAAFFPDNLEYGLLLSAAQASAGQARDALPVIEKLHRLNSAAADPRIDVAEARATESLGDYGRALDAARRAIRYAQRTGARLMEARADIEEGTCLVHLTRPAEAVSSYQAARKICESLGDRACVAGSLTDEGTVRRTRGDLEGASHLFESALAIARQIGDRRATAQTLGSLAAVLRSRADMSGALKLFQETLEIRQETGDKRGTAIALVNVGNILNNTGDPAGARQRYEEALALSREIGERNQISIAAGNLAILNYTHGDLAGGRKQLEEVLRLKQELGDRSSYAYSLGHLGNVLMFQGDLGGARKVWQEQCKIDEQAGEKISLAECQLGLFELDVEEGRPGMSPAPAQKVAAEFTTVNPAADAWKLLAVYYLKTGDLRRAEDAAHRAAELASHSPNLADFGIPVAIVQARVDAAAGRTAMAKQHLTSSLAQANKLGLTGLVLDARLAMCEAGHDLTCARTVRDDAQRLSYVLIARRADQLK